MVKNYHRLTTEHREILMENPLYGKLIVEFRDGWFELINQLGKDILELCDLTGQQLPDIRQVKEKFGTLRYYYKDNCTNETVKRAISALVSKAERQSESICEKCGKYGELTVADGIWETVCDGHREKDSMTVDEWKTLLTKRLEEKNKDK